MHQARFLLPQRFNLGKFLLRYFRKIDAMLSFDRKLYVIKKKKKEKIVTEEQKYDFFENIYVIRKISHIFNFKID